MKIMFLIFVFVLLFISSLCFAQSMAELNPEFENRLINSLRGHNTDANEFKDTSNPFVLFHFSDIHGDKTELERYVEFLGVYGKYFDDAICTGDLVELGANSGFDFGDRFPELRKFSSSRETMILSENGKAGIGPTDLRKMKFGTNILPNISKIGMSNMKRETPIITKIIRERK